MDYGASGQNRVMEGGRPPGRHLGNPPQNGAYIENSGGYGRFEVTCRGPVGFTSVI